MIENVLKMMNAPTSTAAPASASSSGVRKAPSESLIRPASWLACSAPVRTCRLRQRRAGAPGERGSVTPGAAAATTSDTCPGSPYQRCTAASGATMIVAPPIEDTSP